MDEARTGDDASIRIFLLGEGDEELIRTLRCKLEEHRALKGAVSKIETVETMLTLHFRDYQVSEEISSFLKRFVARSVEEYELGYAGAAA